jgi:endoglycosylceramidase
VYDDAYLDKVESLINKLGEKGIYTMVDAHQDVFARSICGEGVPDFYASREKLEHSCSKDIVPEILALLGACKSMDDYGFRFDTNNDPLIEDCQKNNFAMYYTSPESVSAFANLYNNVDGLRDKFLAYWDKVSSRFASN